MKGDTLYWSIACALDWLVWGGELVDHQNLPEEYPVIFVSNHAAALVPIAVVPSLPVRVYPWLISDRMDFVKVPEYLHKDFIEPQLHVPSSLSMTVSRWISQASVRLLRAVECNPVGHGEELLETYHLSVDALVAGKSILIFPEDPAQKMNELYMMTPFYKGFTRLGEMYYAKTKNILRFAHWQCIRLHER